MGIVPRWAHPGAEVICTEGKSRPRHSVKAGEIYTIRSAYWDELTGECYVDLRGHGYGWGLYRFQPAPIEANKAIKNREPKRSRRQGSLHVEPPSSDAGAGAVASPANKLGAV